MSRLAIAIITMFAIFPAYAAESQEVEAEIFKNYLAQAKEGDVTAQFVVARRLEKGIGTPKNIDEAFVWYRKAAEKGHPLAQFIVDSQKPAAKEEPVVEPPKPATPAPKPVAKAPEPVAKPVKVVKAAPAPAPARRNYDTAEVILGGKWLRGKNPVGFLPSSRASCLKANAMQVICFSEKFSHSVGANELVYTVKSTLSNFENSGSFDVHYLYNVLEVDKNKSNAKAYAPNIVAKS
ncbi:MAG: hypothetical protein OEY67_05670, partial [Gammaproteobacteria bacterium]|nr:hypothetical protein [Gammaproteobacteria bacterium]